MSTVTKTRVLGFSLVELMIGIAILGILIAVAIPSYRTWILNAQVRNAAESIQNGLQRARAEALKRNTNVSFTLGAANDSSWSVQVGGGGVPLGNILESRLSNEGSNSVILTPVPAVATTVTFDILGRPIAGGLTSVGIDSTILPTAESQDLSVTIGIGGNIKMCDPNVSSPNPRAC
ncbi:MAG: GspH/FimT family pseudopilin [Sideroxyarcus sp.]|nr:GspH/FimT family pseudopilin [Sideroxyarcus sp.]